MGELDGKVAIITGAGRLRSIGRGAAIALAEMGCSIVAVGTGRDPATFPADEKEIGWRDIESVADEVRAMGPKALALVANVSKRDQVQGIVDATVRELGRVDFLVNNAAAPKGDDRVPLVDLSEEQLRLVLEVKVLGSFFCAQAVSRVLVEQGEGGSIVNVSSIAGKRPRAASAAYAAGNAALDALTAIAGRRSRRPRRDGQLRVPRPGRDLALGLRHRDRGLGEAHQRQRSRSSGPPTATKSADSSRTCALKTPHTSTVSASTWTAES